jgi:hypothetical protein
MGFVRLQSLWWWHWLCWLDSDIDVWKPHFQVLLVAREAKWSFLQVVLPGWISFTAHCFGYQTVSKRIKGNNSWSLAFKMCSIIQLPVSTVQILRKLIPIVWDWEIQFKGTWLMYIWQLWQVTTPRRVTLLHTWHQCPVIGYQTAIVRSN